jgi:hypothetical protein
MPLLDLCALFADALSTKKDAVLEYVHSLLALHYTDEITSKKIMNALIYASNGRVLWILEEFVQRPIYYGSLLASPLKIPDHVTYDLHGHFTQTEAWWTFWESMREASLRRIRFRCMKYKDELMEKTWMPTRVLDWCMDIETRAGVSSSWLLRHQR